jgi:hypothetical protein
MSRQILLNFVNINEYQPIRRVSDCFMRRAPKRYKATALQILSICKQINYFKCAVAQMVEALCYKRVRVPKRQFFFLPIRSSRARSYGLLSL